MGAEQLFEIFKVEIGYVAIIHIPHLALHNVQSGEKLEKDNNFNLPILSQDGCAG